MTRQILGLLLLSAAFLAAGAEAKTSTPAAPAKACYFKTKENGTKSSIISLLVIAHGKSEQKRAEIEVALLTTLAQGCNVNEKTFGVQPLNAAILFGDLKMVRLLLQHGADPYQTIAHPHNEITGLNSFQLVDMIAKDRQKQHPNDKTTAKTYDDIKQVLNKYR